MESMLNYVDYRTFLKDRFDAKKRKRRSWSYGVWARELDLASSSTLIMIMNGDRNPGPRLTEALIRNLKLSGTEASYFIDLISLAKAKGDSRMKVLLMERLGSRLPGGKFSVLSHDNFAAISSWHFYAIRELVQLGSFREDPDWICRKLKFKVTPRQARQAIQTLLRLNLLCRNPDGTLGQASGHVDTATDIADEGLKRFHEQMLEHAKTSVRATDPALRQISGTTFPIHMKNLPKVKELIRKFQAQLCAACEEPGGDAVYHLEISFFPLTKPEKEYQ